MSKSNQSPDLTELTRLIHEWGRDRKIHENSTAAAQARKAMDEWQELAEHVEREDPLPLDLIEDDIGDIYVCLVQVLGCEGISTDCIGYLGGTSELLIWLNLEDYVYNIGRLICGLWCNTFIKDDHIRIHFVQEACREIDRMMLRLCYAVSTQDRGLNMSQCVTRAWNDIKDRRGEIDAVTGKFVKEESSDAPPKASLQDVLKWCHENDVVPGPVNVSSAGEVKIFDSGCGCYSTDVRVPPEIAAVLREFGERR